MTRQGEARRIGAKPSRAGVETKADGDAIARKWPTGRDDERSGINRWTGAGRNGRRRERKSTIVAEGTGRPSVASTCCASRSHFTPLSSLPILCPFLFFNFIFLPFFFPFLNSVSSHPSPKNETLRRSIRPHFQSPGFSPRPLSSTSRKSRAAFYTCITFTAQAMKYAYYTFLAALYFTV